MALIDDETDKSKQNIIHFNDYAQTHTGPQQRRPVLFHLNADTTWLIQLPYPASAQRPPGRSHFNILIDPWLQGPQSDVAAWFSTQWHVVKPSVETIGELNQFLAKIEGDESTPQETEDELRSYIDVVAISHEFTDHCHEATLKELPQSTPVFATEKAADLIRSWKHFDNVITTPGFSASTPDWRKVLSVAPLPCWLGIGRVITAGNALYYHSAVMFAFEQDSGTDATLPSPKAGAIIYSPHGIKGSDLEAIPSAGIDTLALLHGLHDVGIRLTKQLNLGALNGLEAVRACGARYWIATHDEVKQGGGLISWFLRRTQYTVVDAIKNEAETMGKEAPSYEFVELGSGDGLVLL